MGALLLLWPAIWNGRPGTFPDSVQYFSQGRYIATLLHLIPSGAPVPDPYGVMELRRGSPAMAATVMGARSASYSAFLFLTAKLGDLWLPAVLQALAAAWTCRLTVRVVLGGSQGGLSTATYYLAIMVALALCTNLPYFAGTLMPDILAALALLLTALLLAAPDRLSRTERWGATILLGFCIASHGSVPLVAAGVTVLFISARRPLMSPRLKAALPVLAALAAAVSFNGAYQTLVRAGPAGPLTRPPFLTARVLEDQHGGRLLHKICGETDPFAICAYKNKPLARSEDVLWSSDPAKSAFLLADYATRRRMEAEDTRVALAALLADPVAQGLATTQDIGLQLIRISVDDPLSNPATYRRKPIWHDTGYLDVVFNPKPCETPTACRTTIPPSLYRLTPRFTVIGSLVLLIYGLARPGMLKALRADQGGDLRRFLTLMALVALGLVLNAVVCSALSGPFPRYQARLIWLLPMFTVLGCILSERSLRRVKQATAEGAPAVI